MNKKSITSLTSVVVSGFLAAQGLPASAQVQTDDAALTQSEASASKPAAPDQVYVGPAAFSTTVTHYQSGESYSDSIRPGKKLIIAGGALFGVTYLSTVLGAAIASDLCQANSSLGCREASWPIYLPVVGPFIQMAYISGTGANTGRAILGIDGALQAGGLAMFIAGAVMWGGSRPQFAQRIQLVPYSASTGTGLLALGRF